MPLQSTSTVVQIFAKDVPRSIAFYRLLGLAVPEPEGPDPHVAVDLPGGGVLSFDAEQTIIGMRPWEQRYATVLDPDGNVVDLFAPLTTSP